MSMAALGGPVLLPTSMLVQSCFTDIAFWRSKNYIDVQQFPIRYKQNFRNHLFNLKSPKNLILE